MPAVEVTAIVPLKHVDAAKGRLADALDAGERRHLVRWLLGHVVDVCWSTTFVSRVLVVAGDQTGAAWAEDLDAEVLVVPRPGLDHALAAADRQVPADGASLIVPVDLPWSDRRDLEAVWAARPAGRGVVVARSEDGGTGALLRTPAHVIPTAFGIGSAATHQRLAERAGVPVVVVDLPGLARDLDTPRDLVRAGGWAGLEDVLPALPR